MCLRGAVYPNSSSRGKADRDYSKLFYAHCCLLRDDDVYSPIWTWLPPYSSSWLRQSRWLREFNTTVAAHLKSFTTAPTSSGNTRICATNWIFPQSFGLREIAEGKSDAYSHDEQLQRIHFLAAYLCLDHTHTHIYALSLAHASVLFFRPLAP